MLSEEIFRTGSNLTHCGQELIGFLTFLLTEQMTLRASKDQF